MLPSLVASSILNLYFKLPKMHWLVSVASFVLPATRYDIFVENAFSLSHHQLLFVIV